MTAATTTVHDRLMVSYFAQRPAEAARALSHYETHDIAGILGRCEVAAAVAVLEYIDPDLAAAALLRMEDAPAQRLLGNLDTADAAAVLTRMQSEDREALMRGQPAYRRRELQELLSHAPETAGALMDPRVTEFHGGMSAAQALARIRRYRERRLTDVCIVDDDHHLVATVPLQEVAIADPDTTLASLVRGEPVRVPATVGRDQLVDLLETTRVASLPVVDFEGRLVGIIRYDSLVQAAQQDASESLQAMVGAGREERALSAPNLAIRKRLPWLQVNLATAFLAAAVVGLFEGTIARFTALAVLLPVVAGQSGNTGAQALAVTMRGLALREIRLGSWFRVLRKEVLVCFVNGCAVALTTSTVVYLWTGTPGIPAVLGVSMVVSMVMAGLAGALIPVVLTSIGQDPAQSASIILTTVTDIVGFLSFLGFATLAADVLHLSL